MSFRIDGVGTWAGSVGTSSGGAGRVIRKSTGTTPGVGKPLLPGGTGRFSLSVGGGTGSAGIVGSGGSGIGSRSGSGGGILGSNLLRSSVSDGLNGLMTGNSGLGSGESGARSGSFRSGSSGCFGSPALLA